MPNRTAEEIIAKTFLDLAESLERGGPAQRARIAVTGIGGEHGEDTVLAGAMAAQRKGIDVIYIGTLCAEGLRTEYAQTERDAHARMDELLSSGEAQGAVTMHYPFPVGVATVGRAITPGRGREVYLATTTGTTSVNRLGAMLKNAVYGIAVARACGVAEPTVGILNIEGAHQAEAALKKLKENGYPIAFAESSRADKGCLMRGNDLLAGACDVLLCDTLTGNILMKLLSSFTTGGGYESVGYGYGPGVGEGFDKLVTIVSRASGAPVIAGAIEYAAQLLQGNYQDIVKSELAKAKAAGLDRLCQPAQTAAPVPAAQPAKEVVVYEITGVEVTDIEDAVHALWNAGIYAEGGMGCTGPVILVAEAKAEAAEAALRAGGWLA